MRRLVVACVLVLVAAPVYAESRISLDREEFVTMLHQVDVLKQDRELCDGQVTLHKQLDREQRQLRVLQAGQIADLNRLIEVWKVREAMLGAENFQLSQRIEEIGKWSTVKNWVIGAETMAIVAAGVFAWVVW